MNIRDLKYLVALSETQHFGQAAERCFVSQPTLSMQIKRMEEELDVTLFERSNKTVLLTPVGETLINQARKILNEVDSLYQMAENVKDPLSGVFRLGIIPTMCPYYLPLLLPAIKKSLPKLDLIIVENKTDIITRDLQKGDLDAIILALPIHNDNLVEKHLFDEDFVLAVAKDNDLKSKKKIKVCDIDLSKLLLLEEGHCLRDQALSVCGMLGDNPENEVKAASLETLRHLVASDLGVTLLPEHAVKTKDAKINILQFSSPAPSRKVGIVWRKNTARGEVCEKIFAIAKKVL